MSIDQLRQGATTPEAEGYPKFTFDTPGTELYGQVMAARFGIETRFGDADLIEVNDHVQGPVTLWLSNVQLKAGLVEGRNQLGRPVADGDLVYVRFDRSEPRPGGKTLKHFSVNLAAGQPPAQPASPPPFPTQV